MRLYGPVGARNFPADRNPTTIALGSSTLTVTGGTSGNTALYIAPAGRRAILNYDVEMIVSAALAAAQNAFVQCAVTPSGGASNNAAQGKLLGATALGVSKRVSGTIQLKPGDQALTGGTLIAGAGTIDVSGGLEGIEYDS